jgi:hypothetical protein
MGKNRYFIAIFATILLLLGTSTAGCRSNAHPDDRAAVYKVLDAHDFASVEVSQDRGAGVITLRGVVGSADRKARAEQLVRQTAPGYAVKNQLQVQSSETIVPSLRAEPAVAADFFVGARPAMAQSDTPARA